MNTPQCSPVWTRRAWLTSQGGTVAAALLTSPTWRILRNGRTSVGHGSAEVAVPVAQHAEQIDPAPWKIFAQQAVAAAKVAGAQYADARLTRMVQHIYQTVACGGELLFRTETELVGIGVRALVNGCWGFSASAIITPDTIDGLAQDAVAQAKVNAQATPRHVDLDTIPRATGSWTTPIKIDPFAIPIEEKIDYAASWGQCARIAGITLRGGFLSFVRQERVLATSAGTLVTQTCYESAGSFEVGHGCMDQRGTVSVHGIDPAGAGWELFMDAKIPEQFLSGRLKQELDTQEALQRQAKPATIGKYTIVCDGSTMASLAEATLGTASQVDRALGYEANASGTSSLDAPLTMLGQEQVTAPLLTLTANRSMPGALATVQWDEEGVVPEEATLIQDGILMDYQTTREQAAWLAPWYQKQGRAIKSHGYAAAQNAHFVPIQHMPNLALIPGTTVQTASVRLEDLAADVSEGILVEDGRVTADFQARTGLLQGRLREIRNGRPGRPLAGGAVLFTTHELWRNVRAVGGPVTTMSRSWSQYEGHTPASAPKGEPAQRTGHSVRAVAALIGDQPLIDPKRKI